MTFDSVKAMYEDAHNGKSANATVVFTIEPKPDIQVSDADIQKTTDAINDIEKIFKKMFCSAVVTIV